MSGARGARGIRLTTATALAVALLVTGCTGDGSPGPTTAPTADDAVAPSPTPETTFVPVHADLDGVAAQFEVGPVVRDGDLAVLHLRVTGSDPERMIHAGALGFIFLELDPNKPNHVRLLDPRTREVRLAAYDADGARAATASEHLASAGEPIEVAAVYAAPETDMISVLLPTVGLVDRVPVVDASDAPEDLPDLAEVLAELDVTADGLTAPVLRAEAHRELLGGEVRATESAGVVDVAIASDVLFAVDSADLSSEADAALVAAGAQVDGYEGGRLTVIGHTDDVADDAYNQTLSERRAQAVADRLAEVVDLSRYEVVVEGRGESEPAVAGTSDEDRRLNRRVELRFEASEPGPAEPTDAGSGGEADVGALPEAAGPVGTAEEGVLVTYPGVDPDGPDREVHVAVDEVRRVDGVLVGTLRATLRSSAATTVYEPFSQLAWDSRGELAPALQVAATGVTLMHGGERVFPLDHAASAAEDSDGTSVTRHPLADMILNRTLEPGEGLRVTVVWPDLGTDEVTVDVPAVELPASGSTAGTPWRVTGVPVLTAD